MAFSAIGTKIEKESIFSMRSKDVEMRAHHSLGEALLLEGCGFSDIEFSPIEDIQNRGIGRIVALGTVTMSPGEIMKVRQHMADYHRREAAEIEATISLDGIEFDDALVFLAPEPFAKWMTPEQMLGEL